MGKEINKLRKVGDGAGFKVDVLLEEIADEVVKRLPPASAPIDEAVLTERIAVVVEARVGAKLSDVLEAMKTNADGNKVDAEAIIKGVANLMQPQLQGQIVEAAKGAAQEAVRVLFNQFEEKMQQVKTKAEDSNPGPNAATMSLGSLFQLLLANTESIAKLIAALRPPPTPEIKAAELLGMSLRLADKIDKIKSGQAQIGDLTKDIQESLAQKK